MENLSKKAKEVYNKLQQQMQEVIAADKVREPKLTEAEKANIVTWEARIEKNKPILARLLNMIETKDARLTYLERNGQQLITDGGDVDELVAERELLKPALQLLSETHRAVSMEITIDESNIQKTKEAARARELKEA